MIGLKNNIIHSFRKRERDVVQKKIHVEKAAKLKSVLNSGSVKKRTWQVFNRQQAKPMLAILVILNFVMRNILSVIYRHEEFFP